MEKKTEPKQQEINQVVKEEEKQSVAKVKVEKKEKNLHNLLTLMKLKKMI